MAILPGLTLLLGLSDLLSLDVGLQTPRVEFVPRPQLARIEDYPFQVSLRVNDEHRCGGSIISENKILTAAHCVHNIPVYELTVRVGSSRHFDGQSYAVRAIELHPTYNRTNLDCDIAFVTLIRYLTFGPLVNSIELADRRAVDGALADVIGWGVLSEGLQVPSDILKVATVRLVNQHSCRALYPGNIITSRMVCAGYEVFGRDPCQGDSGSPLIDRGTGKQIGVVSWGVGAVCSGSALPTVYASVPELIHSKEV